MECGSAKSRFLDSLLSAYKSMTKFLTDDQVTSLSQTDEILATDCQLSWSAETAALKCATAGDVFDLLTHSYRILTDLEAEIAFASPDVVLVFREWEDRACPHLEFRGFVFANQLTALSQYDFRFAYDDVLLNRDKILDGITQYFESAVRPRFVDNALFPNGQYVVDFVVIMREGAIEEVKVIEMNRFNITTGGSLFDWDEDGDVLFGRKPFEFRVVQRWAMKPKDFHYWMVPDFRDLRRHCYEVILDERNRE
jgi:hypothetical protein